MAAGSALTRDTELAHARFWIDGSVSTEVAVKLTELLLAMGALPCPPSPDMDVDDDGTPATAAAQGGRQASFDADAITHIITLTPTFPGHAKVARLNAAAAKAGEVAGKAATAAPDKGKRGSLIAVVTPRWLTRSFDLKRRMDEQFYSPDPRMIFSGVVVCTEGLLNGDSAAVMGVVAALGGQWRVALNVDVTHLVCTETSGTKYKRWGEVGWKLGMRVVLPHWIDDCIKLQQRVPEDDYLFPDPPCLAESLSKPTPYPKRLQAFLGLPYTPAYQMGSCGLLDPHAPGKATQAYLDNLASTAQNRPLKEPGTTSVFSGRRVYIASSCNLAVERLEMFKSRIEDAGGKCLLATSIGKRVSALAKADIVVVNRREGWEFWKAHEAQKTIGNLDWLIFVLFGGDQPSAAVLPSPMDRMLHYPWPQTAIPEFGNYSLTVSGYAGSSREYVKKMIELLGATFEGTMTKGKTKHVIASTFSGSKVQHAQLWNIPITHHRWIEDCFASWSFRALANPAYTNYDAGGPDFSFANLAGTRGVQPAMIDEWARREEVQLERQTSLAELDNALAAEAAGAGALAETEETLQEELPGNGPRNASSLGASASIGGKPASRPISRVLESSAQIQPQRRDSTSTEQPVRPKKAASTVKLPLQAEPTADIDMSDAAAPPSPIPQRVSRPPKAATPDARNGTAVEPDSSSAVGSPLPAGTSQVKPKRKRNSDVAKLLDMEQAGSWAATPPMQRSRKAAQVAAERLHEIMPDANRAEEERRGGGKKRLDEMFGSAGPDSAKGKKRVSLPVNGRSSARASSSSARSRSAESEASEAEDEDIDDDGLPDSPAKHVRMEDPPTPRVVPNGKAKGRVAALKPAQVSTDYSSFDAPPGRKHTVVPAKSKVLVEGKKIHIATTGVELNEAMRKAMVKMGAKLLGSDLTGCTHVIVKSISRTPKFLQGISLGVYFVTEQWMKDSINQAVFLDEARYMLKDEEGEKKHGISLERSVRKARSRKVFDDQTFYITPKVQPAFDFLKPIAEAGGAKVIKRNPTVKMLQDKADCYVISSVEERAAWEVLAQNGIPVFSGELIIKGVLLQDMKLEPFTLQLEEA